MRSVNILIIASVIMLMVTSSEPSLAQPPKSQDDVLKARSTSPFEIAEIVNKASRSWRKNQEEINIDLSSAWDRLNINHGVFDDCTYCEASIFRSELNGKPGREVILKLSKSFDTCRYLIFAPAKLAGSRRARWKLLGHIDHDFNRYQMATHRVLRAFGRNWFVLRGQEGSGSGYYLYGETWFEVGNRGVRPVLHYSVDGYTDPGTGGLKWELEGRPFTLKSNPIDKPVIKLAFTVLYTAKDFDDPDIGKLFITKRHAYFVWNKHSREFGFDSRRSTISELQMDAVANAGLEPSEENDGMKVGQSTFFSSLKGFVGSGFEVFLRLNVDRLRKIAQGRSSRMKEWLRRFLEECDNIPEKLTLEIALKNQLPQLRKQR